MRYNFLHISLPSSAVLSQVDAWNDHVLYRLRNVATTTASFLHFHLELYTVVAYLTWANFKSHWRSEQIYTFANFACKIKIHLLPGVALDVVVVDA